MTTYKFAPHTKTFKKRVTCSACGKKMSRQVTLSETQNPFNVNKETGLPKTIGEIYRSLSVKGEKWMEQEPDEMCAACESASDGAA